MIDLDFDVQNSQKCIKITLNVLAQDTATIVLLLENWSFKNYFDLIRRSLECMYSILIPILLVIFSIELIHVIVDKK